MTNTTPADQAAPLRRAGVLAPMVVSDAGGRNHRHSVVYLIEQLGCCFLDCMIVTWSEYR
jgi:hypothetical protein